MHIKEHRVQTHFSTTEQFLRRFTSCQTQHKSTCCTFKLYIFISLFDHHMAQTIQHRGRKGCALDSNPQRFETAGGGDTCSFTDINGSTSTSTNLKSSQHQIIHAHISFIPSTVPQLSRKSVISLELKAFCCLYKPGKIGFVVSKSKRALRFHSSLAVAW